MLVIDDLLDDRQPDTGTFFFVLFSKGLKEFKYLFMIFRVNADPIIFNENAGTTVHVLLPLAADETVS